MNMAEKLRRHAAAAHGLFLTAHTCELIVDDRLALRAATNDSKNIGAAELALIAREIATASAVTAEALAASNPPDPDAGPWTTLISIDLFGRTISAIAESAIDRHHRDPELALLASESVYRHLSMFGSFAARVDLETTPPGWVAVAPMEIRFTANSLIHAAASTDSPPLARALTEDAHRLLAANAATEFVPAGRIPMPPRTV